MSVLELSPEQLILGLVQLTTSPKFFGNNSHLTPEELAGMLLDPPLWPTKPVFTPYALTHHGYSQSKSLPTIASQYLTKSIVKIEGTKYLTHRVTFVAHYGPEAMVGEDISHTLHIGLKTSQ